MQPVRNYVFMLFIILSAACNQDTTPQEDDSNYILPYRKNERYFVLQGVGGAFSHTQTFYHAFDFRMDIGTTVIASRAGRVTAVQESFEDGNRTPGQENYVIIQHADGSYARYFHLTKNGALIDAGTFVSRGDIIGLSGDTGFSTRPHLHFDVTISCALPAPQCQTISIEFSNAEDRVPVSGKEYTAL